MVPKLFTFFLLSLASISLFAQSPSDRGHLTLQVGFPYAASISVGYEAPDLLRQRTKSELRPLARFGVQDSPALSSRGIWGSLGMGYLYGSGRHRLDSSLELMLMRNLVTDRSPIPMPFGRVFTGYRGYSRSGTRWGRVGIGFPEIIQFGIGWKI